MESPINLCSPMRGSPGVGHGRASREPTPAKPAVEISVDTSVDSDAILRAIEGIIPGFVDHSDADRVGGQSPTRQERVPKYSSKATKGDDQGI